MALNLYDRVKETTTVTGTGTATLLGATTGFQSFAVVGNDNTTYYCIADQGGPNWEVGIGTYTASGTTLARTTVLSSSNANALVVFPVGIKDVFVTYPSSKGLWKDASGNAIGLGTPSAGVLTNCTLPQLSASTGSTLVGTTNGGTGAVTRTVASKLNDTVSVLDFGADPTGVADSTNAINNAAIARGTKGILVINKGSYLFSGTVYNVATDFIWSTSDFSSGVAKMAQAQSCAMLITMDAPDTDTLSRTALSTTMNAWGTQHATNIYAGISNQSTGGGGNPAIYASATSVNLPTSWTAALHGETRQAGGTTIAISCESASFSTNGSFYGLVVNNTTTGQIGNTHAITGNPPVAHPSATGILITGNNSTDPMGGWVKGLIFEVQSMRAGGTSISINASALVTSHFQTSTASASSTADILLQGNSAYGIVLNGTYTNGAIRLGVTQSIGWEATNTIKSYLQSGNSIWTLANGSERFGVTVNATPNIRLNATQVVGIRDTGWTAMTGTTDKASAFATSTVTLAQLAGRVMAMQTALTTHGLLGA